MNKLNMSLLLNRSLERRSIHGTARQPMSGVFGLVFLLGLIINSSVFASQNPPIEEKQHAGRETVDVGHENGTGSRVLLELFTSQACSSCPKADILLPTFIARNDVIVLSMSIDYWDYLGWPDTFGQPIFTARQRSYGKKFEDGMVYTPQMVVDGRHHVNGSDRKAIETLIEQRKKERSRQPGVPLDVKAMDDMLLISVGSSKKGVAARKGTLWMALFSKRQTVKIQRGENRGRFLTYHNVVRELTPIGQWVGEKLTLKLPKKQIMQRGADGCVVLLQKGDGGPIVAAAQIASW